MSSTVTSKLHPSLIRSYSLYRKTLRVAHSLRQQNTQKYGIRSRRVSQKIPSLRIYRFVRDQLNHSFRLHKENKVPFSVVQYHNEYRLKWILQGLNTLYKEASQKHFVKRTLRLSPQLNILRQATLGHGNDVFRELLIRSFIVEAQNIPHYRLEKRQKLLKKLSARDERMKEQMSTERLGYMVRHVTSEMTDEDIQGQERRVRLAEEDRMQQEMLREEIEEEAKLRERHVNEV